MSERGRARRRLTLEEWEQWSAFIARYVFALFGMTLISVDAVLLRGDDTWFRVVLLLVGSACMGPTVAVALGGLLRAAKGQR